MFLSLNIVELKMYVFLLKTNDLKYLIYTKDYLLYTEYLYDYLLHEIILSQNKIALLIQRCSAVSVCTLNTSV